MSDMLQERYDTARLRLEHLAAALQRRERGHKCAPGKHETGGGTSWANWLTQKEMERVIGRALPEGLWAGHQITRCLACGQHLLRDYGGQNETPVTKEQAGKLGFEFGRAE